MKNKLYILWTTDNANTAQLMVLMYAVNSMKRQWWDEVTVIVWGAASKLVAEDEYIQEEIAIAKQEGVHISACLSCAEQLGTTDRLRALDLELIYWGEPLTRILKSGETLLTI